MTSANTIINDVEYLVSWTCSMQGWRISVAKWTEENDLEYLVPEVQYIYPTLFEALLAALCTAVPDEEAEALEYYINEDLGVETLWEDDIEECDTNHEWIGEPLYCSACGVDKGNERNSNA